ncbi:MAG: hypothetical protein J1E62_06860 [Lachnospiraceae bacterium]|nr:hypothetical protein [Lachnospiraceae bacterium]
MDNGVGETKSTNGILMEDEILETSPVAPQPVQVPQAQSQQQTVQQQVVQQPQPSISGQYGAMQQAQSAQAPRQPVAQQQAAQALNAQRTAQQPQSQQSVPGQYGGAQSVQRPQIQSQTQVQSQPSTSGQYGAVPQSQAQVQSQQQAAQQQAAAQALQSQRAAQASQMSQQPAAGQQAAASALQAQRVALQSQQPTAQYGAALQAHAAQVQSRQSASSYGAGQTDASQPRQSSSSFTTAQQTDTLRPEQGGWKKPEDTSTQGLSKTNAGYRPKFQSKNIYGKPDIFEKFAGRDSNIFLGLIGALVGDALGAVFMVWCDYNGYWGFIGGACIIYIALILYSLLGGGLDKKGVIVCAILALPTIFIANQAGWALWFMKQVNDEMSLKLDFQHVFFSMRTILKELGLKYIIYYYVDIVASIILYIVGLVESLVKVGIATKYNNY